RARHAQQPDRSRIAPGHPGSLASDPVGRAGPDPGEAAREPAVDAVPRTDDAGRSEASMKTLTSDELARVSGGVCIKIDLGSLIQQLAALQQGGAPQGGAPQGGAA